MAHFTQFSLSPPGGEVGQHLTERENYFQTWVSFCIVVERRSHTKRAFPLLSLLLSTFNPD